MARRERTSPLEDLMDLVARLPWWAGVALALLSYLVLHDIAEEQVGFKGQPSEVGSMLRHTFWVAGANVGQYFLPLIFFGCAAMSAWRRLSRQKLVVNVAQSHISNALGSMTWHEFGMLVAEGFRLQGYRVTETGGGGADSGIDLVLSRPGKFGSEKFLVQCKQWRAMKVGVNVVRELYGVMSATGAAGGFVVTSGRFTEAAADFGSGRNVKLIDGPKLHAMIRQAKASQFAEQPLGA